MNVSLITWQKIRVTKAVNLLEENIDRYERIAKIYLENENTLKRLTNNLHALGTEQKIELANAFGECVKNGNLCFGLAKNIKKLYKEAFSKLDTQRHFHNIFGGGANDLAVFLYYSSDRRLSKLVERIQFIQLDEELLKRVSAYIKPDEDLLRIVSTYIK